MTLTDAAGNKIRNAAMTRAAILEAARKRFAREGYDGASLREIASDAGVDAALISRYFGSKDELFMEVVSLACEPNPEFFDGDPAGFGERMATALLEDKLADAKLDMFLIMLLSASSPKAAEMVRVCSRGKFFEFFQDWLGGPDADIRARVASNIMMGMSLGRVIDDMPDMPADRRDKMRDRLARIIQAAIDP
ncbi:TetR/AcrR family transcriptional regulator [Caulobacter mirabilis]|uniref:TetR family transcriptional regulator n=1 Tax=Caulobacter mirabilis TaxID=69666 RepID=A0A2D2B1M1_9CAUL|nr:TetR/AcrR family transcriptional regulator [Caulobacter mirabilis]ATQ44162.1 TetR family transcriptional regulator [Caulobacter mirabilis]